jgi:hypothetical protein
MANLVVSKKCIGGIYTWSAATGVVGNYAMQVSIPGKAVIDRFWIKTIITGVSAGGGTGSFTLGIGGQLLMVPNAAPAFSSVFPMLAGVDFNANPFVVVTTTQIYFNIAIAPWTAGQIAFVCEYTYMDI